MNRRDLLSSAAAGMSLFATSRFLSAEDSPSDTEKSVTYRVREILGAEIQIDGGNSVGTVDDLVLDSHGNVDYLIVVNEDNKYVTIPWDATQFNVDKKVATVHITQEKYQQVPVYSSEQYPVFSTPAYRTQTYQYFGLTPGQQRRMIRRALRNR